MSLRLEFLKTLSDPNIAYSAHAIGTVGIIAELYNPGAILPGMVGAISLILAFYSLQSLPVNYAGVLLFLLGVVFLILEATITSCGLLAIGGIISMLLGSVMLIKTDVEFLQISWSVILPVVALPPPLFLLNGRNGSKAMRRLPVTGREEMVGLVGIVKTALTPQGQLAVHGELWEAISETAPARRQSGSHALDGLRLHVKPVAEERGLIWVRSRVRLCSCFS